MILKNFIVIEGIDGSGTTTQLQRLVKLCEEKSIKVFATQEPTHSCIGTLINSFLTHKVHFSDEAVVRLFATDRAEHVYGKNGIISYLDEGYIVISDRYLFSSLAYQGMGKLKSLVEKENDAFPLPEILFFLDVSPQTAMQRIKKRGDEKQRYEVLNFLTRVRENYVHTMENFKQKTDIKLFTIDANASIDEVFEQIVSKIKETGRTFTK